MYGYPGGGWEDCFVMLITNHKKIYLISRIKEKVIKMQIIFSQMLLLPNALRSDLGSYHILSTYALEFKSFPFNSTYEEASLICNSPLLAL